MTNEISQTPIQIAWLNFTKSVQILLVPQVDDRPLDQYLSFREEVLALVQNEHFLNDLNVGMGPPPEPSGIVNALLAELRAFPLAVEVAQTTGKPEETKSWWGKMLSRASTTVGSVQDLMQNLPPYAKSALILFKELIDLFKG